MDRRDHLPSGDIMLLFCNYPTFVITSENDTKKAQGGKHVIYTTHHPAWDAKTRIAMPETIGLNYDNIVFAFETTKKNTPSIKPPVAEPEDSAYERLRCIMAESGVTEDEVRSVVAAKGHFAEAKRCDRREKFKSARDRELRIFISELTEKPLVLEEWDEELWVSILETATVQRNGYITFLFKDGTSIEVGAE